MSLANLEYGKPVKNVRIFLKYIYRKNIDKCRLDFIKADIKKHRQVSKYSKIELNHKLFFLGDCGPG